MPTQSCSTPLWGKPGHYQKEVEKARLKDHFRRGSGTLRETFRKVLSSHGVIRRAGADSVRPV
jgi:hypothetical protein